MDVPTKVLPDLQQPGSEPVKTLEEEIRAPEAKKEDASPKEPVQSELVQPQKPPVGYVPYQSLEEERAKRKEAEREKAEAEQKYKALEEASSVLPEDDGAVITPDEELAKEVKSLKEEIKTLKESRSMDALLAQYPVLADKIQELHEFQESEYPNMGLDKVAKIFLAEKGLLETKEPRKGLEKPSGGIKTPSPTEPSEEELKDLRENHPRKYEKLIKEGKIGN